MLKFLETENLQADLFHHVPSQHYGYAWEESKESLGLGNERERCCWSKQDDEEAKEGLQVLHRNPKSNLGEAKNLQGLYLGNGRQGCC